MNSYELLRIITNSCDFLQISRQILPEKRVKIDSWIGRHGSRTVNSPSNYRPSCILARSSIMETVSRAAVKSFAKLHHKLFRGISLLKQNKTGRFFKYFFNFFIVVCVVFCTYISWLSIRLWRGYFREGFWMYQFSPVARVLGLFGN